MPDNTQAEAQGGAAGEAAVRQDSIEPGDDWIEQVLPYGCLPAFRRQFNEKPSIIPGCLLVALQAAWPLSTD